MRRRIGPTNRPREKPRNGRKARARVRSAGPPRKRKAKKNDPKAGRHEGGANPENDANSWVIAYRAYKAEAKTADDAAKNAAKRAAAAEQLIAKLRAQFGATDSSSVK